MSSVTLPLARVPLGTVVIDGKRINVDIEPEWMRALFMLVSRTGGVTPVTGIEDLALENECVIDSEADRETARRAQELAIEIEHLRSVNNSLSARIDAIEQVIESQRMNDAGRNLQYRVEIVEQSLESIRIPNDLTHRVQTIEDRLS